jgi:hypothetical protein
MRFNGCEAEDEDQDRTSRESKSKRDEDVAGIERLPQSALAVSPKMREVQLMVCTFSMMSIASCERRSIDRPRPREHAPRVIHDCIIARICLPCQ